MIMAVMAQLFKGLSAKKNLLVIKSSSTQEIKFPSISLPQKCGGFLLLLTFFGQK